MTKMKRVRIKQYNEMRWIDAVRYNTSYGLFYSPTNPPVPRPGVKDYYVCKSCVFSPARTCYKYKKCTSCPQWSKTSIDLEKGKTNCRCNTIPHGGKCEYYKPFTFGYKATILLCDEINSKE